MNNKFNIFDTFEINSNQNNRILIVGESGSGKSSLASSLLLIMDELNKHLKRVIFIYGGICKVKERLIPLFVKANIKIEEKYIKNSKDLNDINCENYGFGDLVFIDDLSAELASRNQQLMNFLNKAFTTSRSQCYDVIAIFHAFKLFNGMMRNNATLLIFPKITKAINEEFKDYIIEPIEPLIFDLNRGLKQKQLNLDEIDGASLTESKLLNNITIKNLEKFPNFKRKNYKSVYIDIDSNDEKFKYEIPKKYLPMLNKLNETDGMYGCNLPKSIKDKIVDEAKSERKIINKGEKSVGNDNFNSPMFPNLGFRNRRK